MQPHRASNLKFSLRFVRLCYISASVAVLYKGRLHTGEVCPAAESSRKKQADAPDFAQRPSAEEYSRTASYTKNGADFPYNENLVGKCEKYLLFFGICGKIYSAS